MAGPFLVIVGDAVHTATWHQNGLTIPTPGTNPVANTGGLWAFSVLMIVLGWSLGSGRDFGGVATP